MGTEPAYIAICQETLAAMAKELLNFMFHYEAGFIQFFENTLGYFGMDGSGGSAKPVKSYIEPEVDIIVNFKITAAEFLGANLFLRRPGFGGCTVFIGAAYIERLVAPETAKTGKNVCRKNLDEVSQMRDIVYIGKS